MSFKQRFYTGYFSNQASRTATDLDKQHWYNCIYYHHEVRPHLPNDRTAKILELGAGYGSLQLYLKGEGYTEVTGVDISEQQVKIANEQGADSVYVADVIQTLEQADGLDLIIGIDLLEHFTREEALELFDKCMSALKPGGKVLFRCPNVDAPMGTVYAFGDLTHDLFLNKSAAEQLLLAGGFQEVAVQQSHVWTPGLVKGIIARILWKALNLRMRLWLMASGRSTKSAILTPNLVITGRKQSPL